MTHPYSKFYCPNKKSTASASSLQALFLSDPQQWWLSIQLVYNTLQMTQKIKSINGRGTLILLVLTKNKGLHT